MTRYLDLFAALAAPIPPREVRTRSGGKGGDQQYIKVQTVFNRLDDVLGPADWWDSYQVLDELTVECALTIRLPDGSTLTKRDVGIRKPIEAGRVDPGCSWKAAYSDALKRAASKLGVARELCKCGMPSYVPRTEDDRQAVARPAPDVSQARPPYHNGGEPRDQRGGNAVGNAPRTGRQLYRWAMDQDDRDGIGLVKYLTSWAKLQDFPGRMVDWDSDQVGLGHAEAVRKLQSIESRSEAIAS